MKLQRPMLRGVAALAIISALWGGISGAAQAQAPALGYYVDPQGRQQPLQGVGVQGLDRISGLKCIVGMSSTCQLPGGGSSGGPYTLLSNASATGTPVSGIQGGSYIWSCTGTFSTLTLQALGPDASTYLTVTTMSSASSVGVVLGGNATAKVTVAGGSTPNINCTLS